MYSASLPLSPCNQEQAYLEAMLGAAQLRRISDALARPPLATCLRVNTLRTTPQVLRAGGMLPGAAPRRFSRTLQQPLAYDVSFAPLGNDKAAEPLHALLLELEMPLRAAGHAHRLPQPPSCTPLPVCNPSATPALILQDLLRRLPAHLTREDAALLEQNPAYVHPLLPDAIILPGSGPHAIDYSRAGEAAATLCLSLHAGCRQHHTARPMHAGPSAATSMHARLAPVPPARLPRMPFSRGRPQSTTFATAHHPMLHCRGAGGGAWPQGGGVGDAWRPRLCPRAAGGVCR